MNIIDNSKILYLIYDGDCILCKNTALALQIKKVVGQLEVINARDPHSLIDEAEDEGYDLNEGILVKFYGRYYQGSEALQFLATIGSDTGLFNKLWIFIFSSEYLSAFCYPILKFVRNILLFIQGISPIPIPSKPLFAMIFGSKVVVLPKILQKRYCLAPYSDGQVIFKGKINIYPSKILVILAPLFKFMGNLPCYPAKNIDTTVEFVSEQMSDKISMNRTFYYRNKPSYHFNSDLRYLKNNILIELMQLGMAAKLIYKLNRNKVIIEYGGYFLHFGRLLIPLPISWIIGKFHAYEEAIDDRQFTMQVSLYHPLFGEIYKYATTFEIEDSNE